MSPALLKKYLEAARRVAEHVVLKPNGFVFAPHPVVTETDRDKYCVKRIVDYYRRQPTDLADYFMTAWRFKHRGGVGKAKATLAEFAARDKISPKYLATIWSTLAENKEETGPMATLQAMWRQLPAPIGKQADVARAGCARMRDFVVGLRQKLRPEVTNLSIHGIAPGSQPLVLWKDRQYAANRRHYDRGVLQTKSDPESDGEPATNTVSEPALLIPAEGSARARYEAAFDRFCRVFPDAFYVSERVLVFLKEDKESRGRLLSAGFHLMTGYFRDDAPLYDLILDAGEQRELDALWEEFHFVTADATRQYKDFIFFERAEPPSTRAGSARRSCLPRCDGHRRCSPIRPAQSINRIGRRADRAAVFSPRSSARSRGPSSVPCTDCSR